MNCVLRKYLHTTCNQTNSSLFLNEFKFISPYFTNLKPYAIRVVVILDYGVENMEPSLRTFSQRVTALDVVNSVTNNIIMLLKT